MGETMKILRTPCNGGPLSGCLCQKSRFVAEECRSRDLVRRLTGSLRPRAWLGAPLPTGPTPYAMDVFSTLGIAGKL